MIDQLLVDNQSSENGAYTGEEAGIQVLGMKMTRTCPVIDEYQKIVHHYFAPSEVQKVSM